MPQLLNYLGQDAHDPLALDFSSLCVYRCVAGSFVMRGLTSIVQRSCSASCNPHTGSPYAQEIVWIQGAELSGGGFTSLPNAD